LAINPQTLTSKLDISAPPWLRPTQKAWVPLPIHKQYGAEPLPELTTIRLEENIAEKIARLNRVTPARDMYDLAWAARTRSISNSLDWSLIRRLAVLKVWVDANGLHAGNTYWPPAHFALPFEPERWLRDRSKEDFDVADIGALAVPTPSASELAQTISGDYGFLADLDETESTIAHIDERDRRLLIKTLRKLPDSSFQEEEFY
jgi:hypothetical protein